MTMPDGKPKNDSRETRALSTSIELRSIGDAGEQRTAAGYAVLFNNETDIGGYWREKFAPGAFTQSLSERDVVALLGHMRDRPVGRMSRGTLVLAEDAKGLAFTNDLPDTSDGRDLAVQIERGDIEGMSFGFRTLKEEWDETVEPPLRTVIQAEIYEITYTAFPAYPDTSVGMRSLEHARQERRENNQAGARARIAARKARQAHAERRI